jgi:hypothetical protein
MKHRLPLIVLSTLLILTMICSPQASTQGPEADPPPVPAGDPGGMPGRAIPERPIPYHRPGHPSKATNYTVQETRLNAEGVEETVQLKGLDATLADGTMHDPLEGNYRLVEEDQILLGQYNSNNGQFGLQSVDVVTGTQWTLDLIDGTLRTHEPARQTDVATGDLNGDDIDEQIAAWLDPSGNLVLSVGEMPATSSLTPPKVTSAPAALAQGDGSVELAARGYDDALWTSHLDGSAWSAWQQGGGLLASSPALVSRGVGAFDAFAIGTDGAIYSKQVVRLKQVSAGLGQVCGIRLDGTLVCWGGAAPPGGTFTQVSAGGFFSYFGGSAHACGIKSDGTVACWGDNGSGQAAPLAGTFTQISANGSHACGVRTDGTVACWGANSQGQSSPPSGTFVQVSAGGAHTCAVRSNNTVACWGLNSSGEASPPGGTFTQVSAGQHHTCGVRTDGAIACWGTNGSGQSSPPVGTFTQVSAGLWHTCGLRRDGLLACWGASLAGEATPPAGTFVEVSANALLTCGQRSDGSLECSSNAYPGLWRREVAPDFEPVGDPAVVARGATELDLLLRASDDTLRRSHYDGSAWGAWENLGGMISTAPAAVVAPGSGALWAFARGVDGALWHCAYAGSACAWQRLDAPAGVELASKPAAIVAGAGQVAVYARGSDDALWQIVHDGAWGAWQSLGGTLDSAPAAASHGGQIDLFAQSEGGLVQRTHYDGTSWSAWEPMDALGCCTGALGSPSGAPAADTRFGVRVEAGHFLGAGREAFAVAYVRNDNKQLHVAVYDVQDGFGPVQLGSYDLDTGFQEPGLIHPWYQAWHEGKYDLTVGDLDGDGVDELAVATIKPTWHYDFFYYYDLNSNPHLHFLDVSCAGASCSLSPLMLDYIIPWRTYFDANVHLAAGDLDYTGYPADYNGDEVVIDVAGAYHGEYDYIEQLAVYHYWTTDPLEWFGGRWLQTLDKSVDYAGVAVGDIDGDTRDEIVHASPMEVRWTGWYTLYVWELRDGELVDAKEFKFPWANRWAVEVADLNGDVREDIALVGCRWNETCRLDLYEGSQPADTEALHQVDVGWARSASLALGDFSGESVRAGPPTFRVQNDARQLFAVINTPPRHRDVLNGQVVDVNSQAPDTYVRYENRFDQTTEVECSVHSSWGIASGLEITAGDPEGTHVTTSINNTYGEDLNETTGTYTQTLSGLDAYVRLADMIQYAATDYYVWEYPLYHEGETTPATYVTVVIPQKAWGGEGDTNYTDMSGASCGSSYRPNHQLNNVLSYPKDQRYFTDLAGGQLLRNLDKLWLGGVGYDSYFEWSQIDESYYSRATNLGVSAGVEAQVGGDKIPLIGVRIPWSVKATFQSSYDRGTLSTHRLATQEETSLHVLMDDIANEHNYAVTPYTYWAEDGYLVVDYVTEPDASSTFWTSHYAALPDPAFSLPWLDGSCAYGTQFSRDVTVEPPYAHVGDTVAISATVRNFSLKPVSGVKVDFYHGDPDAGGTKINAAEITVDLEARGVQKVSAQWTAQGVGQQEIYAVLDRGNQISEVHDEMDAINNNKAFGILQMGAGAFVDPGPAAIQPYESLQLAGGFEGLEITAYLPRVFSDTVRFFDLTYPDVASLGAGIAGVGEPFELAAYDENGNKVSGLSLRAAQDAPPAVIAVDYGAGTGNESSLRLFRQTSTGWVEATCAGYSIYRFPEEDRVAVPVCETGVFAFGDEPPTERKRILLPVVLR